MRSPASLFVLVSALVLATALGTTSVDAHSVAERVKRDGPNDKGITNLDIRDAILQLLQVVRQGNNQLTAARSEDAELLREIKDLLARGLRGGSDATDRKIDNISTFLLRMNAKLDSIERKLKRSRSQANGEMLEALVQDSFDILTHLPVYIQNTKDAVTNSAEKNEVAFRKLESILVDDTDANGQRKSLARVVLDAESNVLRANGELKDVVVESGHMAEVLFERVGEGYTRLEEEIEGLSNVERVLVDTADAVMDTKRKIEFGVQQIIFKVSELVKLSGGQIDEQLRDQFKDITETILSNQTQALGSLTRKVEKEIGQVWRQMGVMYGQVSNSIQMLEKVKDFTEGYVNKTGRNLGTMEGQVEGLTDRMVDVDSNLNYMLRQLSLVVQEFNQVKTGLGEAMEGLGDELEDIKEYKRSEDGQQQQEQPAGASGPAAEPVAATGDEGIQGES